MTETLLFVGCENQAQRRGPDQFVWIVETQSWLIVVGAPGVSLSREIRIDPPSDCVLERKNVHRRLPGVVVFVGSLTRSVASQLLVKISERSS